MRYSSRLFLYAPILILLVLAAAAMLRWRAVAGDFEGRLLQANGRQIAPGVTLHFASEAIGGFPFNVDAVLDDVTIDIDSAHGPLVWHTGHFAVHELTFGRAQEIFEAAGMQELSWTDASGDAHRFAFVPGALRASAISAKSRLVRFDLDVNGIGSRDLWGARVQLHFRPAAERSAVDIVVSADALHLSPMLQAGLGTDLHHLLIAGHFAPGAAFWPLLSGHDAWKSAADRWRRSNGTLHLDRIEIDWGMLKTEGHGTVALDDGNRPEGSISLRIAGAEHLPPPPDTGGRFAAALRALTKAIPSTPGAPLAVAVVLNHGRATVSSADLKTTALPAGSLVAIY